MNKNEIVRKIKKLTRKKPLSEKVLELKAQIHVLEDDLEAHIMRDTAEVKRCRAAGTNNLRAEARIKNAYYTLLLLRMARDDLNEVQTDSALNSVINGTGRAIAKLNCLADFSPKIGEKFFNWQAEILNERAVKKPEKNANTPFGNEVNLSEDIVNRLVAGQFVEDCVNVDWTRITNNGIDGYSTDYMNFSSEEQENIDEFLAKAREEMNL